MQKENDDLVVKFFVDSQNNVTISCPQCGASKTIDAAKMKKPFKRLKVRCKCGYSFKGSIEFRKSYRKNVKLLGQYVQLNRSRRGEILVEDISMGGVGFTCAAPHAIRPGDPLEVSFVLDDAKSSKITMKVTARSVKDRFVGAERTDSTAYQQALGFYLM